MSNIRNLASKILHLKTREGGFTLIELMVTISLIIIFVASAVGYNRSMDQQISIFREQGKVANAIYQARSMAITTFNRTALSTDVPCGYGIHIESSSSLVLFKDLPDVSGQCKIYSQPTAGSIYTGLDENVSVVQLVGASIGLPGGGVIDPSYPVDILFVPPDPQVFSNRGLSNPPLTLVLSAPRITTTLNISINQFGQISVQ